MKYVDEFRNPALARGLAARIHSSVRDDRTYRLMEFCGGHTHAIFRFGLHELLPKNVEFVHGPGCPVCVLPASRVDLAVSLALQSGITLCTYGDVLRVPGWKGRSLLSAKAEGADVRIVYSPMDALQLAERNPQRKVVFFAIGFETTAPATACVLLHAQRMRLPNFFVHCNHVLTPSAIQHILESPELRTWGAPALDGFLGPSHVSAIIGSRPYEYFVEEYRRPVVITGFEPLDVIEAVGMLVRQINEGRAEVENQYTRVVTREGNRSAQASVAEVFELRKLFEWRGLGPIPYSALRLKREFVDFDAEERFPIPEMPVKENRACACGAILRGLKKPTDCVLFGKACTPARPLGSCMVSSEGACAAYYNYRGLQ
jgi:hydrogenase expression/formation protein HypD